VRADAPPVPKIKTPVAGTRYKGGMVVSYSGKATDPEDGAVPGSSLTWEVVFHHASHTHPFVPPTPGASGTFTIPTQGETATDVFYRIHLTARDSGGNAVETFRDILPTLSRVKVDTKPTGLSVLVDGQPHPAPYEFEGVVGMLRSIGVVSPQSSGGTTYTFASWSDGLPMVHDVTVKGTTRSYVARFTFPTAPGELQSPAPGSTLGGPSALFQWSAGAGVTEYRLRVGNAPGNGRYFTKSAGTALQLSVTGLPTDGRTLFVTLRSLIDGAWQDRDYTLTAAP
jgi:hypothetical protein